MPFGWQSCWAIAEPDWTPCERAAASHTCLPPAGMMKCQAPQAKTGRLPIGRCRRHPQLLLGLSAEGYHGRVACIGRSTQRAARRWGPPH